MDGEEKDRGFMMLKRETETQCGTNNFPLEGSACQVGLRICFLPDQEQTKIYTNINLFCYTFGLPGQDGGVESVHVCGCCGVLSDNSYPVGAQWTQ